MKFALLVLVACLLSACSTIEKPFLYRAVKADRSLSIFGTVHLGVPGWDLPRNVTQEVEQADIAYFETDPIKLVQEMRETMESRLYVREGDKTLDQWLTKDEFDVVVSYLEKFSADQVKTFRPLMASALISEKMGGVLVSDYEARSLDFTNGLDYSLAKIAQAKAVPIESLDSTAYDVCREADDVIYVEQIKSVLRGRTQDDAHSEIRELIEAYRMGDEAKVMRLISSDPTKCVLGERNQRWANVLRKNVAPGAHSFVAVGVAHLMDSKDGPGLLTLLRKQGYKVKRVTREE